MLLRFSLYGFLKNQRYFEAFLILAFLEKGLDFFEIGLLVAAREFTVVLLEVPSGAIADVRGRRLVMILAFVAYIASFLILGLAEHAAWLLPGMILFGVGDSFRTGTHKAMIFTWLRLHDRTDERVRVYGYTRSWSKYGSAVSVVLAAVIVWSTDRFSDVFLVAIIPYAIAIVNFLGYPKELDGDREQHRSLRDVNRHMIDAIRTAIGQRGLRRLIIESMGFDGVFAAVKDYLQPVLQTAALALATSLLAGADVSDIRWTVLLVAPVYFLLFVLAGTASRLSHRIADRAGGEERAARRLWAVSGLAFIAMTAAGWFDAAAVCIVAFVVLHVIQNVWRPILISRFDQRSEPDQAASILSIESQGHRAVTMILAPLLGLAVDYSGQLAGAGRFWPVGAVGLVVSSLFLITGSRSR